jgi:anthranilate synthase/aminodeoxychorismate synthase-like glutamine amidotransferase
MSAPRVLLIDHRDSFASLLGEQFAVVGAELRTVRAPSTSAGIAAEVAAFDPDLVVLSPGPGRPEAAGGTVPWLATAPAVPVLGVCLGHQAIGLALGAAVVRAPRPVHGRATAIDLVDDPLFAGLPRQLSVARYHSLVVTDLPPVLQVVAVSADADALVMAMRHRTRPWLGLQFHPESVLTPFGRELVARVLAGAVAHRRPAAVRSGESA